MDTTMHTHTQLETSESSETQAPGGTVERADRAYEPEPPLYSIDGAMPPDVLEARAQWLERNPWHPGRSLDLMRERKSLGVPEAAAQLGHSPSGARLRIQYQTGLQRLVKDSRGAWPVATYEPVESVRSLRSLWTALQRPPGMPEITHSLAADRLPAR